MKKLLAVLAAMFLLGGYAFAAEMKPGDAAGKNDAGMAEKNTMMKDCCMMQDGKMMMMKNGKRMLMDADMSMPNGTMVMKDGTCTMMDGTRMMMKEGDRMDMNGNMMKKGYNRKDHIMMKNGKMMIIKDGKKTALGSTMPMPNGVMVMPDGTCTMEDGTKLMMKDGDKMDMEGNMIGKKNMADKGKTGK